MAGTQASGSGSSGGSGARCTGSARSRVPNVPVTRTRSSGPASPGCTTRTDAVDALRPTRNTSTCTSTGPGTAADRKCALHVSGSACPTAASTSDAVDVANAMSTPPLIACPMSQPSPR